MHTCTVDALKSRTLKIEKYRSLNPTLLREGYGSLGRGSWLGIAHINDLNTAQFQEFFQGGKYCYGVCLDESHCYILQQDLRSTLEPILACISGSSSHGEIFFNIHCFSSIYFIKVPKLLFLFIYSFFLFFFLIYLFIYLFIYQLFACSVN